ncbi:MarR family winged helix-turn-helix transcriptional regulator [Microbacterium abyssi]|uniref:MarR family winged helix-turn-helix transcriptional regulator n=1 Tax=Microbacterium abyssi TaxID=2782166 RepID=UPI0018877B56|nr:MarR family transcriptional regulator [Microbacterium sp. A18JL241]
MSATGRKTPTREQLHVWREFLETTEKLQSELGGRLQAESAISSADYKVLLALSEAPDRRYRSSVLADEIGWERSRLSHHLGRMERRGLISRVACADDSRGSEIVITAEGAETFRRCSVPHLRDIRELFIDALRPAQLSAVADATTALKHHLERSSVIRSA